MSGFHAAPQVDGRLLGELVGVPVTRSKFFTKQLLVEYGIAALARSPLVAFLKKPFLRKLL